MIKCVFIDMDNTIAENTTCDNIDFYKGLYINKRPIKIVLDGIKELYKECSYVIISKTDGEKAGLIEKTLWIQKYFPEVNHMILINPKNNKSDYIINYITKNNLNPDECLLIDDKKTILQECKKIGINVKYPQQIICDYEENQSKKLIKKI